MSLELFSQRCRLCLEESPLKVDIDDSIETKFYEMTQLMLDSSKQLPSFICYECYEIITNYSQHRRKFIENQCKLDELLMSAEESIEEDENNLIDYEEVIINKQEEEEEQIILEETDDEEEELRLEDLVKPEFMHYCLPKKPDPEPVKVYQIPVQLETKKALINKVLGTQKVDHVCSECGQSFKNSKLLLEHEKSAHPKFVCMVEDCKKTFKCELILNRHIEMSHRTRIYSCEYCDKKFSQKVHLTNHMFAHTHTE